MKKSVKVLLIILVIAALAVGGYFIYKKFFANNMEVIEKGEGEVLYYDAWERFDKKTIFSTSYSVDRGAAEENGYITVDDNGWYKEWTRGDKSGSKYVVAIGGGQYGLFIDETGTKTSSTIAESVRSASYSEIFQLDYLGFLEFKNTESGRSFMITDFYEDVTIEGEKEFEDVFGKVKDGYVFQTTLKCVYSDNGKKYTSTLVRKVYFDTLITKVTYSKTDKELSDDGSVKRKGDKKNEEISYSISYKTNQTIVKSNFSEYPIVG